ncbi:glycine cleavage system protein GcvH [Rubrivirga sp. S365]|uniref:Glycine cleavage system H protein n=1 Tax=Rubrivirga litoralis TaxID=3075598 RepID=A0ABU3BRW6_9BACT|nr:MULTISPECIES: glycine cleavage system protein GcvH [unclassified Rubrivirga]MDT0632028.1 glycine cleavage system protein GcvH [Rubrivirga sp. F394]MDT7855279.1 glycine cleavage system protein GcvH [Rubrivirga sp. S365]
MTFPDDCRYTKDHEWVRLEDDGLVTVGITDYAQSELGDIVFVEMEAEGTEVEAEGPFGTVEAVKTVSELFAPIAGTVESVNPDLDDAPESVNTDPYGAGWMVKLRPAQASDVDGLLSVDEYKEMIGAD